MRRSQSASGTFEKFLLIEKKHFARRTAYDHMAIATQICEIGQREPESILMEAPNGTFQYDQAALEDVLQKVCGKIVV